MGKVARPLERCLTSKFRRASDADRDRGVFVHGSSVLDSSVEVKQNRLRGMATI